MTLSFFIILVLALNISVVIEAKNFRGTIDWVFDGIPQYILVFLIVTLVTMTIYVQDLKVILMSILMIMVSLILAPYMKYSMVNPFDNLVHYGSIVATIRKGHIKHAGIYSMQYASTPMPHIAPAMHVITANIDVKTSMALRVCIMQIITILLIYVLSKRLKLERTYFKFVMLSVTFSMLWSVGAAAYSFTGTTFTMPYYTLLLFFFAKFLAFKDLPKTSDFILVLIIAITLTLSHFVTSIFTIILAGILLILNIPFIKNSKHLKRRNTKLALVSTVILGLILIYHLCTSYILMKKFTEYVELHMRSIFEGEYRHIEMYTRSRILHELALIDILRALIFKFGRHAIALILSLIGSMIFMMKTYRCSLGERQRLIFLFFIFILLVCTFLFVAEQLYRASGRTLIYSHVAMPFTAGIAIYRLFSTLKNRKNLTSAFVVITSFLILVAIFQVFGASWLIPKIKETPLLVRYIWVTDYQISMGKFIDIYMSKDVSDIYGETHVIWTLWGLIQVSKQQHLIFGNLLDLKKNTFRPLSSLKPIALIPFSVSLKANYINYNLFKILLTYYKEADKLCSIIYSNNGWFIFIKLN